MTASTTDYWTAKALGPVGMLAVEALRRRALDQELAERPAAEQLERTKPEPQWVKDLRERMETNKQNPRVTVRGTVIAEGGSRRTAARSTSARPHRDLRDPSWPSMWRRRT